MERKMKHIQKFKGSLNEKLLIYELISKIDNAIESNIKEIPYEGTDVDQVGIRDSILEIIYEICPQYKPR